MRTQSIQIPKTAHAVLTESYMVYVVLLIPAMVITSFYPTSSAMLSLLPLGILLMCLAPLLIMWAQRASEHFRDKKKTNELVTADFMHGPYQFVRFPTHLGLFLLTIGLSITMGSFIIFCAALLAHIVTHVVFLPNEDKLLVEKYGEPYREYKKIVRLSI